ncbi:hypothetical protein CKAH01_00182 [Colletotrichum kahawae]|uniref:Uncharacterized protein n=1 Tax=Colletotrichum kahawae TaxID=34407 RepID=A0AAE0DCV1_COLKA|nr:hypothetical protein CKAH01_00182 [Colletotrichum kahawae]
MVLLAYRAFEILSGIFRDGFPATEMASERRGVRTKNHPQTVEAVRRSWSVMFDISGPRSAMGRDIRPVSGSKGSTDFLSNIRKYLVARHDWERWEAGGAGEEPFTATGFGQVTVDGPF